MSPRRIAVALIAACAVAVLTGCAPAAHAPTQTPTPTFTSEAQAFQAAEETYRAYVDALNHVDTRRPATFEDVYKWATGTAKASDKKVLTGYHSSGTRISGESVVTVVIPASTSAPFSSVELAACLDVSAIQLLDPSGKSVVNPERPEIQSISVTLDRSSSSRTGLLVSNIFAREGAPSC
ncbi:hypothetical protein GCM10022240_15700 [Microbacterium kribbense]|uniref:Lipoprotein n=1 Tax=Microbacterium kribbense TaxID=433645 RepID=A0ABP7GH61_9MICO